MYADHGAVVMPPPALPTPTVATSGLPTEADVHRELLALLRGGALPPTAPPTPADVNPANTWMSAAAMRPSAVVVAPAPTPTAAVASPQTQTVVEMSRGPALTVQQDRRSPAPPAPPPRALREANLQAQVRVLEQEVGLLRRGLAAHASHPRTATAPVRSSSIPPVKPVRAGATVRTTSAGRLRSTSARTTTTALASASASASRSAAMTAGGARFVPVAKEYVNTANGGLHSRSREVPLQGEGVGASVLPNPSGGPIYPAMVAWDQQTNDALRSGAAPFMWASADPSRWQRRAADGEAQTAHYVNSSAPVMGATYMPPTTQAPPTASQPIPAVAPAAPQPVASGLPSSLAIHVNGAAAAPTSDSTQQLVQMLLTQNQELRAEVAASKESITQRDDVLRRTVAVLQYAEAEKAMQSRPKSQEAHTGASESTAATNAASLLTEELIRTQQAAATARQAQLQAEQLYAETLQRLQECTRDIDQLRQVCKDLRTVSQTVAPAAPPVAVSSAQNVPTTPPLVIPPPALPAVPVPVASTLAPATAAAVPTPLTATTTPAPTAALTTPASSAIVAPQTSTSIPIVSAVSSQAPPLPQLPTPAPAAAASMPPLAATAPPAPPASDLRAALDQSLQKQSELEQQLQQAQRKLTAWEGWYAKSIHQQTSRTAQEAATATPQQHAEPSVLPNAGYPYTSLLELSAGAGSGSRPANVLRSMAGVAENNGGVCATPGVYTRTVVEPLRAAPRSLDGYSKPLGDVPSGGYTPSGIVEQVAKHAAIRELANRDREAAEQRLAMIQAHEQHCEHVEAAASQHSSTEWLQQLLAEKPRTVTDPREAVCTPPPSAKRS